MNTTNAQVIEAPADTFVAAYIRLTRDESLQTGLSAPAQRKGIHEYARRANLEPVRIFEETKAIGGDVDFDHRPAGRSLVQAILNGACKHVIVRDLDRLTRDIRLGLELIDMCRHYGVVLHTFTGPIQTKSASDRFAFHVRSAAAEFEKNQTGDRVRKAKREAAEQGRWQGPPAYGFTSQAWHRSKLIATGMPREQAEAEACLQYPQKAKLYINEKEAETIRLIYELAQSGLGTRRLVNELNNRGYRTRTGGLWTTERLCRTVNNPAAAGYVTYDTDYEESGLHTPKQKQAMFKAGHEPIISLDIWQKIQRQRQSNTHPVNRGGDPTKAGRKYLLSGILRCQCGSPMRGKSLRARDTAGRYVCCKTFYYGRKVINGCDLPTSSINAGRIHEVFWTHLRRILGSNDLVERVYTAAQHIIKRSGKHKSHAGTLAQAMAKIEGQIATWYSRHDDAKNEAEQTAAWRRIVELTEQKNHVEKAHNEQERLGVNPATITKDQIANYLQSLANLVDTHNPDEAKTFIQTLVDHHGLSVRIIGPETMEIALGIRSPGTAITEVVKVVVDAPLPKDQVTQWVRDRQGSHTCPLCNKPITILRRHFWLGIPEHHSACWSRELSRQRHERKDKLLTGAEVARRLGIGRTTLGRWLVSGKISQPAKREHGLLLWQPEQINTAR